MSNNSGMSIDSNSSINKASYLDQAVEAAKVNKGSRELGISSSKSIIKNSEQTSQLEDIKNTKISGESILKDNPDLENVKKFTKEESQIISKDLMEAVKDRGIILKVLMALGSIQQICGEIAAQEQEEASKAASMLVNYMKPISDAIKSEGDTLAQETRDQADMSIAQGVAGIAASAVEIGAGVGSLMGTAEETAENEETLSDNKGVKASEEDIEEENEEDMEETTLKTVDDNEEEEIESTNTRQEDNVDDKENDSDEKLANKGKWSTFKKGFKNTLKALGANQMMLGYSASRIITSSEKLYDSYMQGKIADLQEDKAEYSALQSSLKTSQDILQSSQQRAFAAAKVMEDTRDSLGGAIKDFNQANLQSVRSVFG